jgi:hypothetical protein
MNDEYDSLDTVDDDFDSENPNDCIIASLMGLGYPVLIRKSLDDPILAINVDSLMVRYK